jgi:hypothetical protein
MQRLVSIHCPALDPAELQTPRGIESAPQVVLDNDAALLVRKPAQRVLGGGWELRNALASNSFDSAPIMPPMHGETRVGRLRRASCTEATDRFLNSELCGGFDFGDSVTYIMQVQYM